MDGAVGERCDVEQQIAAHAGALRQHANQLLGALVGRFGGGTPQPVHGDAELPPALGRRHRLTLLGGEVVAVFPEPVVQDHPRPPSAQLRHQLVEAPLLYSPLPIAIEPQQIRREVGTQLLQLQAVEAQETLPALGRILSAHGIAETHSGIGGISEKGWRLAIGFEDRGVVGMAPVQVRVVEAGFEAASAQRRAEGSHQITTGRGVAHRRQALGGVPQRHSVMVLGGQHRIARPGLSEKRGPRVWIVFAGIEDMTLGHVVIVTDKVAWITVASGGVTVLEERPGGIVLAHRPDAPVDENSEAGAGEPGEIGRSGRRMGAHAVVSAVAVRVSRRCALRSGLRGKRTVQTMAASRKGSGVRAKAQRR